MKVLANDGISATGAAAIQASGHELSTTKVAQNQLIDYINEHQVDVILVRSATTVRKDMIDACPSLKGIGRGGVGMDNIDVEYAREKGLKVFNTPAGRYVIVDVSTKDSSQVSGDIDGRGWVNYQGLGYFCGSFNFL